MSMQSGTRRGEKKEKTDGRINDANAEEQDPGSGIRGLLRRYDTTLYLYLRTIRCAVTEGPKEAGRRYREYVNENGRPAFTGHILSPETREKQRGTVFSEEVTFSIPVLLRNPPRRDLKELVRSLEDQTYGKWELCLADGSDEKHKGTGRFCRRKAERDPRIRYRRLAGDLSGPEKSREYLQMASGQYIGFLDQNGRLHPSALYEAMKAVDEKKADFIYTDEAVFDKKPGNIRRFEYKPDFSPDLLRGYNYIRRFSVFSRELMEKAGGGFRPGYGECREYDLILRLTEKADEIVHIPEALYFRRRCPDSGSSAASAGPRTDETGKKALEDHLKRVGLEGEVTASSFAGIYRIRYRIQGKPKISIVIPNMDHSGDLRKCIDSIREKTTWKDWEIIIVENNSREKETFDYYREIAAEDPRIRVVVREGGFNFSAVCNYGVSFAAGDYLLLLNNDMEVITPEWLEEMIMFAQRKDVGAVGCMLYYPDDTVQHAGVIVGLGAAAGHSHRWFRRGEPGYLYRMAAAQNLSAVTGACMMVPRHVYEEAGGLDESFRIAFNDVDLCMRIRQKGYLVVFTPFAELYHYESRSRGSDETGEKRERFEKEAARFREKWAEETAEGDPYYNPNLTLRREDFSLKNLAETGREKERRNHTDRTGI